MPGQAVKRCGCDTHGKADFCPLDRGPSVADRHVPQNTRPQTDPEIEAQMSKMSGNVQAINNQNVLCADRLNRVN